MASQQIVIHPDCCERGTGAIEWRFRDGLYGPEQDGWAMVTGSTDYGSADVHENIAFCPWCGRNLGEVGKEAKP